MLPAKITVKESEWFGGKDPIACWKEYTLSSSVAGALIKEMKVADIDFSTEPVIYHVQLIKRVTDLFSYIINVEYCHEYRECTPEQKKEYLINRLACHDIELEFV